MIVREHLAPNTAHAELVEAPAKTLRQAQGERNGEVARGVRFAGYAAVFDRVDRGGDLIRRGAFRGSLGTRETPLLWEHRRGRAIGRIERIEEDAKGLRVIGRVTDAGAAEAMADGLRGLSVGYRVREARVGKRRELITLDLVEVSLVARPMQPLARVVAVEGFSPSPSCD